MNKLQNLKTLELVFCFCVLSSRVFLLLSAQFVAQINLIGPNNPAGTNKRTRVQSVENTASKFYRADEAAVSWKTTKTLLL